MSVLVTHASRYVKWVPFLLSLLLVLVYLPSLGGSYLNWDDPWLIAENPNLRQPDLSALVRIWTDWSTETRLQLGAEYLPVRDTSLWFEAHLWGLEPQRLRWSNLAIYIASALCLRAALLRTLPSRLMAEVTALVFAVHPVHVESAAWLAGRKDVLMLLFTGAGLWAYSAGSARQRLLVLPLFLLAHLSKSMSVIGVGLLLAQDVLQRRRPAIRLLAAVTVLAALMLLLHLEVGSGVKMSGEPIAGSRWTAMLTMGPVWLRYLGCMLWPPMLSLVHDVQPVTAVSATAVLGYLLLGGWGVLGVWWYLRPRAETQGFDAGAICLGAWLWFVVPLLPVSQVFFPLQNLMADRYLVFSVMAIALLLGALATTRWRVMQAMAWGAAFGFLCSTLGRSALFADSALVFKDATAKTQYSTLAPYQLAEGYVELGRFAEAHAAYLTVLDRDAGRNTQTARRATNNLARLLVRTGDLEQARRVLQRGVERWPDSAKMLSNLAKVNRFQGRMREAKELTDQLQQRFPDYATRKDLGSLKHIVEPH